MGFFGSSKSPEEMLEDYEEEILDEIWSIIDSEESDIEDLKDLEAEGSIETAERALKSLAVGVEQDLSTVEESEEELSLKIENSNIDSDVEEALRHNLKLLVAVSHHLEEIEGYLGENVERISREAPEEEQGDLLRIEAEAERRLERIKQEIESGGTEFERGWIHVEEIAS